MKTLKYLLSLALIFFISCTDDDNDLSFLNSVEAPSNVSALFQITQDNTGLVTITPSSEGGATYKITLGDNTAEPVSVDQGDNIEHTYAEGTYTVVVEATGITGLTASATLDLVVSFRAPENLVVTIENDAGISKQVNVTATADFAMTFEVDFGDGSDIVLANIGETASHLYEDPGLYTINVTAMGGAIETTTYTEVDFEVTEISQPLTKAPMPPFRADGDVISMYSETYASTSSAATVDMFVTDWSVLTSQDEVIIEDNNTLVYYGLNYAGIITEASPIDASGMEFFHVDVWTKDVSTFKIKFVDFNGTGYNNNIDNIEFEVENAIDPAGEWISLDIPLSDFEGVPFSDINQMVIAAVPTGTTVFLDNLYFWKQPSVFNDLPVSFDNSSLTYTWSGFGDPGFGPIPTAIIANPDPSGINITANVLEIEKPAGSQVWAGASMALDNPIDFANNGTTLTIKVWSPRAGVPILFKTEDPSSPPDGNGNPSVFAEVIATTTKANEWEELSFDMTSFPGFSTSISYENTIIFPDFNNAGQGETFYFDDIEFASVKFPINFETSSLSYTWTGFGDPGFGPIPTAIITNPDPSGINASGTVLEVQKPAGSQVWAGASMPLDAPVDFTYGTTAKIKIWSPRSGVPFLLKMEDLNSPPDGNGNPSVFVEVLGTTNTANGWEEITFDLTSFGTFSTSIEYGNVIVFPDFNNAGQGETFYFDDFILTN